MQSDSGPLSLCGSTHFLLSQEDGLLNILARVSYACSFNFSNRAHRDFFVLLPRELVRWQYSEVSQEIVDE